MGVSEGLQGPQCIVDQAGLWHVCRGMRMHVYACVCAHVFACTCFCFDPCQLWTAGLDYGAQVACTFDAVMWLTT